MAAPSFFDPKFEVVNNFPEAVSVVATWGSNVKDIGRIEPMSSHQFSLDDEAAITFKVRYSSGREVESEPMYFTSGSKVVATISRNGIEMRYDFET